METSAPIGATSSMAADALEKPIRSRRFERFARGAKRMATEVVRYSPGGGGGPTPISANTHERSVCTWKRRTHRGVIQEPSGGLASCMNASGPLAGARIRRCFLERSDSLCSAASGLNRGTGKSVADRSRKISSPNIEVDKAGASARIYATALGAYKFSDQRTKRGRRNSGPGMDGLRERVMYQGMTSRDVKLGRTPLRRCLLLAGTRRRCSGFGRVIIMEQLRRHC